MSSSRIVAILAPALLVAVMFPHTSSRADVDAGPSTADGGVGNPSKEPLLGELQRIGPVGSQILVLGLDAPGFEELTPKERVLAYYLSRAAIAGHSIFTHQFHRAAPELITLLDEIDLHRDALDPATAAVVRQELLRLLIHHGPHDHWEHVKHQSWGLTPALLNKAALAAERHGARLPRRADESTQQMLDRLVPFLLDPNVEPVHVERGLGKDIIANSAVNLYARGITQPMIEGLLGFWQRKINVRFDLADGKVMLEEYKVGGRYSQELWLVSHWLKKALPLALSREQADSIHALIDFYATGDEGLFREHSIHWLRSDTNIDYLNGFIETYMDPRGVVGSFEANVSCRADGQVLQKLAQNAAYFEARMPFDKKWQRTIEDPPVASVMNVLVATGDTGPLTPTAYNLPNDPEVSNPYGSKNVVLLNVELARSEKDRRAMVDEFHPEEDRANALANGALSRRWMVYLREVIGHGSGRVDPAVRTANAIPGPVYAALEECRADMIALYHLLDPKLVEIGAFANRTVQEQVARDAFVTYLTNDMAQLRTDTSDTLRRAHRRANHLATEFLLDGGGRKKDYGVRRVVHQGKTFITVSDLRKAQQGVADLLSLLQRAKSTGEHKAAVDALTRNGTRIDPRWREEVVTRSTPLNLPRNQAYVFPHLVPVIENGEVVDVVRRHDEDLLAQQRRFMRIAREVVPEQQ